MSGCGLSSGLVGALLLVNNERDLSLFLLFFFLSLTLACGGGGGGGGVK